MDAKKKAVRRPETTKPNKKPAGREALKRTDAPQINPYQVKAVSLRELARFPSENPNPVLRIDGNGNLLYANQAALLQLADWKLEPGRAVGEALINPVREVFESGTARTVEIPCDERIFSIAIEPTPGKKDVALYGQDISQRKQAEQRIVKLNQILHTLSDINQAIVRVDDGTALFQKACRIAVEAGGFRMAWIGLLDEGTSNVRLVAGAGEAGDPSERKGISTLDEPRGRGPSGTAIREQRPEICNDIEHDPRMEPWRALALQAGYRSAAAFPLRVSGKVCGVFSFYAGVKDYFSEEEVKLLDEMTSDLSFAMEFAERERQRKQAEETLRASEERLRSLFENMINGYAYCKMLYDGDRPQDFIYLEVNNAFETLTGLKNVVGKKITKIIPGIRESDPAIFEIYGRVARTGVPETFENYVKSLNMWFAVSVYSPRKEYFVSVFDVITERKHMESRLRASEKKYRRLFTEMGNGAATHEIICDAQGNPVDYVTLDVNSAYEAFLGVKREAVVGKRASSILPPEELKKWMGIFGPVAKTGVSTRYETYSPLNQKHFEGSVYRMARGQFAVTFSDITERKRAEQKLHEYSEHLEEMVAERSRELHEAQEKMVRKEKLATLGELAGSVGHELRNPLGVISNSVYYLNLVLPETSDKVRHHLEMIETETHNAARIVGDLLDYARVTIAEQRPVAVAEIVQKTLERFPVPAQVELRLDLPPNLPQAYVDELHIQQVLGNLVTNAWQAILEPRTGSSTLLEQNTSSTTFVEQNTGATASNQAGTLTIRARRSKLSNGQPAICIQVKDTGAGIRPEHMQQIFDPLFSTKMQGIGLGLAVSKKLAEANGGRIEFVTRLGQGSTFSVYIPTGEGE